MEIILLVFILITVLYITYLVKRMTDAEDRIWELTKYVNEHIRDYEVHK